MYQTAFLRISILLMTACIVSCESKQSVKQLPYYNTPDFTPLFLSSDREVKEKVPHTISTFSFIDQWGNNITERHIDGKIHVANFIFTRCGSICPVMTKHMKLLQDQFRNDTSVVLLSYSVTPWADSVTRLKAYADQNEISAPNWHLLTGNKGEIYQLARKSYYAEEDLGYTKDSTEFLHTEHILLVDKTKRIRGIYNGTLQLETEQLIRDIKELQNNKE
jgi:protein SCO1